MSEKKKKVRSNQKLYVVVCRDLIPGAQACQGLHAFREFVQKYPDIEGRWYKESNFICMLSVPDESALLLLINEARDQGIKWAAFQEPDMNHRFTAVALEPTDEAMRLCELLPLALREYGPPPSAEVERENKV